MSPRESVVTSDAKYEVSQFWNLSGFHRLNSGGERALETSAEEESEVTGWLLGLQEDLRLLRLHRAFPAATGQ